MSLWTRLTNVFRGDRLRSEIAEELESHVAEAMEHGRSEQEARRALGNTLRQREASYRMRVAGWLDALHADVVFGWRQLRRNKVTSAAAVVSLALAMGACVGAFRLMDALLWRPLPVVHPERLYGLSRLATIPNGKIFAYPDWAYPSFVLMREAAKGKAELIAVSKTARTDVTYATDEEMEKAYVQYCSGWMFDNFGLKPAVGRLLNAQDDRTPGAHPYAVLSYDYWKRRFGRDPKIVGKTVRLGEQIFEIVGVGPETFTGTEPGTVTEIFVPTMMNRSVTRKDASWHRTLLIVNPGEPTEPLREKLEAVARRFEMDRLMGGGMPKQVYEMSVNQRVLIEPATSGASTMQEDYRRSLAWMGLLVALVLVIACANVANLMTALAASRAREMALRVAIGAGRWRLIQMVLVESAMLATFAAVGGAVFGWWSAPMVTRMISTPDYPARLNLSADWRVFGFGVALVVAVVLLFGLLPALRTSTVKPVSALKGGEDPHTRRRALHGMVAVQVAFCFVVVFVAGLFIATFRRLESRPLGFDASGLLLLESVAPHGKPPETWAQVGESLRAMPGVERVAESGWPLLSTGSWNGSISVNGGPSSLDFGYFLTVSPGWLETMRMPLLAGRDFRQSDVFPGAAIVNETFVKQFLGGKQAVGTFFEKVNYSGAGQRCQIVGVVADAPYRWLREPILPVAFVPYREVDEKGVVQPESSGTFLIRMKDGDPQAMGAELRRKVSQAGAGLRVSNVQTQQALLDAQMVRERLLAMLGFFFALVALLLACIGLYGVLNYTVLQRQKEIGIRIALGARWSRVVRLVALEIARMVVIGSVAGIVLGLGVARYVESLLYGVKAGDAAMVGIPLATITAAVLIAAIPAARRALRVDPVEMLRAE
jgi:predicted permease